MFICDGLVLVRLTDVWEYKFGVDTVRPEVVDEILEDIHHVGRHIVKRDGVVAAAVRALKQQTPTS